MFNSNLLLTDKIWWIYSLRGLDSSSTIQVHVSCHLCEKSKKYAKSLKISNKAHFLPLKTFIYIYSLFNLFNLLTPSTMQKKKQKEKFNEKFLAKTTYKIRAKRRRLNHKTQLTWYDNFPSPMDIELYARKSSQTTKNFSEVLLIFCFWAFSTC